MTLNRAFVPLLREQARLVERGVRCIALAEGLDNTSRTDDVHELLEAAPRTTAVPFSLGRHLSGYASHTWAIDLFAWARSVPDTQKWGNVAMRGFPHSAHARHL
jgi:hypothetical protein